MTNDPDQIRADIERTRYELSSNVDALATKVSPSNIAQRQADKVRGAAGSVRDAVMGKAEHVSERGSDLSSSVGGSASDATSAVRRKAEGNPLAIGLIAFGAGWLAAALLPASEREQELAQTVKDKAAPLTEGLTDAAKQAAGNLKEPAQAAADSLKASVTGAADAVKQEGQGATAQVKDGATEAAERVRSN